MHCVRPHLSISITNSLVELFALQNKTVFTGLDDAAFGSDRASSVDVVACHHTHKDPCTLAAADGSWHLWNK